jgi:hypothetical protein
MVDGCRVDLSCGGFSRVDRKRSWIDRKNVCFVRDGVVVDDAVEEGQVTMSAAPDADADGEGVGVELELGIIDGSLPSRAFVVGAPDGGDLFVGEESLGFSLDQVEDEARYAVHCMRDLEMTDKLRLVLPILQSSLCLQGKTRDAGYLVGNAMIGERMMEEAIVEGDANGLNLVLVLRLFLAMSFEKWDLIQRLVDMPGIKPVDRLHWSCNFNYFIRGMARFSLYRLTKKRRHLREGLRLTRALHKSDSQSTFGCTGKYLLLKAEYALLKTRNGSHVLIAYHSAKRRLQGRNHSSTRPLSTKEQHLHFWNETNQSVLVRLCIRPSAATPVGELPPKLYGFKSSFMTSCFRQEHVPHFQRQPMCRTAVHAAARGNDQWIAVAAAIPP